jgi:trigger factor
MEYKLIKGNQSNYEINLILTEEDQNKFKEKILKDFQKEFEMPGFRKWHVPLEVVEKFVKPEYIKAWIYEYAINDGIKQIMKENPNLKFIWSIYDLQEKEEDWKIILTFKIDVYPEVEVLNENWKAVKVEKFDDNVSEEEINKVLDQLKLQYAEYKDVDTISENSVAKVKLQFKNKKWEIVEEWTAFVWPEDFKEFKILEKLIWAKKNQEVEFKYSKKDLPPHLQTKDPKKRPAVLVIIPIDIKDRVLPEWNEENIKKYFGDELKTKEDLINKIKEEIKKVKKENYLISSVENILNKIKDSFKIQIPKTILDEEVKTRLQSLTKRFGWEEGFKKYLETIWEQKAKQLYEDIKKAAKESLEKFFVLKKLTELLWIDKDIDWNKPLDAEQKIVEKMTK